MRRAGFQRKAILAGAAALLILSAGCDDCESPDGVPPPIPGGVYTVTGDDYVDVYWNPIYGVDDLAGYGVYRSDASAGPYYRLETLYGVDETYYRDTSAQNGHTYYYAVDAFDFDGNESELSVEDVLDTPRPDREGLQVYSREADSTRAGVDFSQQPNHSQMIVSWNAPRADIYVYEDEDNILRVVGTQIEGEWNLIQDMGWTADLDEIGWAPEFGWVMSPVGLELVEHHTYVIWTWDNYFVKFRVADLHAIYVVVDWAYQIAQGNPELMRPRISAKGVDEP